MKLSPELKSILRSLTDAGGKPYLVGGAVRDFVMGLEPKDFDIEVFNLSVGDVAKALKGYGKIGQVGESFGVTLLKTREQDYDISIPRRERKVGAGHKGFDIQPDPTMTTEEAASRRDYTINALMWDPAAESIVDHFGGLDDIKKGVLRHVSDAFGEDPLRVLRGMQFAGRFNMRLDPVTRAKCAILALEYDTLAKERIWGEWEKWATKSVNHAAGLNFLLESGWLELYPNLAAIVGCPQNPVWHPEGWSVTGLTNVTSTARSGRTDFIAPTIDDVIVPSTNSAELESLFSAARTETVIDLATGRLATTFGATTYNIDLSSSFGPAVIASTERFVLKADNPTADANEVVRVMLPITRPSVFGIVDGAIDDLQVFQEIIRSIAVFMMNVLLPGESTADMKFHNESMEINPTNTSGPCNAFVPTAVIVNFSDDAVYTDTGVILDFHIANNHNPSGSIIPKQSYTVDSNYICHQGDVWVHTLHCVNHAAKVAIREELSLEDKRMLIFAVLCHDLGKPETTEFIRDSKDTPGSEAWRSLSHAEAGVTRGREFLNRIGALKSIIKKVGPLTKYHLAHSNRDIKAKTVRRLAVKLKPATLKELSYVIESDASGRPPLPIGLPDVAKRMFELGREAKVTDGAPDKILTGRVLISEGLMKPGPKMGAVLECAYQAQLDGVITNEETALAWARSFLSP